MTDKDVQTKKKLLFKMKTENLELFERTIIKILVNNNNLLDLLISTTSNLAPLISI